MRPSDKDGAFKTPPVSEGVGGPHPLGSAPANEPLMPTKANRNKISVSPAVLGAASKNEEELFQSLRTAPGGLTQSEAEERAQKAGPNEVVPESRHGWLLRLLKIIRNPLVILLTALSAISFATGDARAGTVMAGMVMLSVALRF